MNKRFYLSLFIISLLFTITIVHADDEPDVFSDATITIDKGSSLSLSDDSLIITTSTELDNISNYMAVIKKEGDPPGCSLSDVLAGSAATDGLGVASGITKVSSKKYKFSKESDFRAFELANEKIYVTLYIINGPNYCPASQFNVEITTPPVPERLANVEVSLNKKNTVDLTDDVLTISKLDIASVNNYKVVLTGHSNDQGSADDSTPLLASGSNFTIANSYYAEKAAQYDTLYLFIYKGTTIVGGGKEIKSNHALDIFSKMKVNLVGNTSTSQSNTALRMSEISLDNVDDYFLEITKETDNGEIGAITNYGAEAEGNNCFNTMNLVEEGTGSSKIYKPENDLCYLEKAEKKGDTYLLVYKDAEPDETICTYSVENGDFLAACQRHTNPPGPYRMLLAEVKVNRPNDLPLGYRLTMKINPDSYLFYMNNLASPTAGGDENSPTFKREATYKIGEVSDNTLLKNIANNKSGVYNDLLTYAKTKTAISFGDIELYPNEERSNGVNLTEEALYPQNKMEVGKYYFVYISYDGEDDGFYSFDEVQFFSTKKNSDGKIELVAEAKPAYEDDEEDEDYNLPGGSEEGTKPSKKNPRTGIKSYTLMGLSIIAVGTIIYNKTRKITKFPQSE